MLRWAIPLLVGLAALSAWWWRTHLATAGDPTYEEDPTAYAGAPGATHGPSGPLPLPGPATAAAKTMRSGEALSRLLGQSLAALSAELGPASVLDRGKGRTVAVWLNALQLDELPPDRHPIAHLCLRLRGEDDTAVVEQVDGIGSLGVVVVTSKPTP